MKNELSIESIKKELIDKLISSMDILKYLEVDKNEYIKLSQVHNTFIYDYDNSDVTGNYITVDVAEYESTDVKVRDSKKYIVSVKMGLEHAYNLDKLSATVKELILELYPNIKTYINVPIYVRKYEYLCLNGYREHNRLNRMIKFEIEENISVE